MPCVIFGSLEPFSAEVQEASRRFPSRFLGRPRRPQNRAHLKVAGWLGRAPSNHFQTASSQKMAGKPLFQNKGGKPRKSQESQREAKAFQPKNSWKDPCPATLKMSSALMRLGGEGLIKP